MLGKRFATANRLIRGVTVKSLKPDILVVAVKSLEPEILLVVAVESLEAKCGGKVTVNCQSSVAINSLIRDIPGTASFENAEGAEEHSSAGIFW